jgi:hypothetical protein
MGDYIVTKQPRNKGRFAKKRDSAIHAAEASGAFHDENFLVDRPMNFCSGTITPLFEPKDEPTFDTDKFMRSINVDEIDFAENERSKFWVRGFLCATVIWGVILFLARVS